MAKSNLRHLNRRELLELLIEVSKENEQLREEIRQLKQRADYPEVSMGNPESEDEVVAQLNSLIRHAQQTCDAYIAQSKQSIQEQQIQAADIPASAGEEQVQEPEPPKEEKILPKANIEDEELCVCQEICLSKKISENESGDRI